MILFNAYLPSCTAFAFSEDIRLGVPTEARLSDYVIAPESAIDLFSVLSVPVLQVTRTLFSNGLGRKRNHSIELNTFT